MVLNFFRGIEGLFSLTIYEAHSLANQQMANLIAIGGVFVAFLAIAVTVVLYIVRNTK